MENPAFGEKPPPSSRATINMNVLAISIFFPDRIQLLKGRLELRANQASSEKLL
jgi:hypothetical protein